MRSACLLIVWLLLVGSSTVSAACDDLCRTAQINALIALYNNNGGSTWSRARQEWASFTSTTSFDSVCLTLVTTQTGYCCLGDSQCVDAGVSDHGIAGLVLAGVNLTGSLPETLISAMSPTLLYLGLYGTCLAQPCFIMSPNKI